MEKHIELHHYALIRDVRGAASETIITGAATPRELFTELGLDETLSLNDSHLRVAVNDEFAGWDDRLRSGDVVVFITPVAGG